MNNVKKGENYIIMSFWFLLRAWTGPGAHLDIYSVGLAVLAQGGKQPREWS